MKQKILKAGNSLVVVVPSKFVNKLGLKKGDLVKLDIFLSKNKIVYYFSGVQQLALAEKI